MKKLIKILFLLFAISKTICENNFKYLLNNSRFEMFYKNTLIGFVEFNPENGYIKTIDIK